MYISKTHPKIKFVLNMCNGCYDNDQKVNDDIMTEGRNDGTG